LRRALPHDYHLHSKVRLEDIVRVKKAIKGQAHWQLRGRVKSRHVDYLITDINGIPKAAIELDGSSHNKAVLNADRLKDGIFEAIGLPLIRVRTGADFTKAAQRIVSNI
jgi:very-short-patch-repair endonuclease